VVDGGEPGVDSRDEGKQRDRLTVVKFSKTGVWDKFPEGSILIFGETQISLQHSVG